jgi:hypothetical protein
MRRAQACAMKRILRNVGPYVLVELLLPGGTLIAVLMWLVHRHIQKRRLPTVTV